MREKGIPETQRLCRNKREGCELQQVGWKAGRRQQKWWGGAPQGDMGSDPVHACMCAAGALSPGSRLPLSVIISELVIFSNSYSCINLKG